MYHNIKSSVMVDGNVSSYFSCNSGVRQGENLSPLLFSIFVNDLEMVLMKQNCKGVNFENNEETVIIFIQLLILLYVDDIVMFSDDPKELQKHLMYFTTNVEVGNKK